MESEISRLKALVRNSMRIAKILANLKNLLAIGELSLIDYENRVEKLKPLMEKHLLKQGEQRFIKLLMGNIF